MSFKPRWYKYKIKRCLLYKLYDWVYDIISPTVYSHHRHWQNGANVGFGDNKTGKILRIGIAIMMKKLLSTLSPGAKFVPFGTVDIHTNWRRYRDLYVTVHAWGYSWFRLISMQVAFQAPSVPSVCRHIHINVMAGPSRFIAVARRHQITRFWQLLPFQDWFRNVDSDV